jgi:hypothetical protein
MKKTTQILFTLIAIITIENSMLLMAADASTKTEKAFQPKPIDVYQYAVKFICGKGEKIHGVEKGHYSTVVNLHNPYYSELVTRKKNKIVYKVALAQPNQDGKISKFSSDEMIDDGARYFGCDQFRQIIENNSSYIDGFFVLYSRHPLDVQTVYTGSSDKGFTMDTETDIARKVQVSEKFWDAKR